MEDLTEYTQTFCTYCGAKCGNHRDHVVPKSFTDNYSFANDLVVPACKQCNCMLSNKMYVTVNERRMYIADRLTEKNRKLLDSPTWSSDEIEQLGPTLKKKVKALQRKKKLVEARIDFALSNILRTAK